MTYVLVLFVLIVRASGQCGDDMVPLEVSKLPAEWDIRTVPHIFLNSQHLRGVISTRGFKISGLDTVVASLQFCPTNMTIYGSLSASRLQVMGNYTCNYDYLTHGTALFAHGDGFVNIILDKFQLTNIVAPLRYSRVVKRVQIDQMEYNANGEVSRPHITGFHVDGENEHDAPPAEFVSIDQSNSYPTLIEFVRAFINYKAKSGVLFSAAKEMFQSALSL